MTITKVNVAYEMVNRTSRLIENLIAGQNIENVITGLQLSGTEWLFITTKWILWLALLHLTQASCCNYSLSIHNRVRQMQQNGAYA